jgi:hypothetical protein
MSWESQGMALLAASLLRPFALAVAAWLFLRAFRVRRPASQHAVWTAMLVGMLLQPVVSVMAPHWRLPVLPAPTTKQAPSTRPVASEPAVFTDFELPALNAMRPQAEDRDEKPTAGLGGIGGPDKKRPTEPRASASGRQPKAKVTSDSLMLAVPCRASSFSWDFAGRRPIQTGQEANLT